MTTVKILLLSTAAVVGIGGTSAALTKDQWWPKSRNEENPPIEETEKDAPKVTDECQSEPQKCTKNDADERDPESSTSRDT